MISILFRLLGALALVAGILYTGAMLAVPTPGAGNYAGGAMIAKLALATPGMGLILSGLLLIAVGEVLWHLQRIARYARATMDSAADIADALEPPKQRKDAAATFNEAVRLFQDTTGKTEPGVAIKELATEALRTKGFLKA